MQPLTDQFTNVPAFLTKLWKMVSDPKTDHLICWSPTGNSFIILNQVQFWYDLLPLYYKHNNMSSFVRQLNMYGFHKVSSVENGSGGDGEKDEVQFFHPYFQKDNAELLKLIKRKVTVAKNTVSSNQISKNEDLTKVLLDVKQLRGRQNSVDSQLAAMKQENAVLWRELAVLRQKHSKQQQIVNKLIQFLVSMVHPTTNRMGVGVKRHYPLMLRATPSKKSKISKDGQSSKPKNDGPTIHELDNELEFDNEIEPEVVLSTTEDDKDFPLIYSPLTPLSGTHSLGVLSPDSQADSANEIVNGGQNEQFDRENEVDDNNELITAWEKPSFVFAENNTVTENSTNDSLTNADVTDYPILNIIKNDVVPQNGNLPLGENRVFISPSSQDTLLSNLTNGSYNTKIVNDMKNNKTKPSKEKSQVETSGDNEEATVNTDLTVATRNSDENRITSTDDCFSDELGMIIENNQSELDLYKDLLRGCGSLDTNALMGLFNDGSLEYGLSFSNEGEIHNNSADPMISSQEISTYPILPLEDLLDDTLNDTEITEDLLEDNLSQLNTPQHILLEPEFPVTKSKKQ